jgi:hypothetical protein
VIVIILIAVAAGAILTILSFYINGSSTTSAQLTGTAYVNQGGRLNATGTNWATYNVTLLAKQGSGNMSLVALTDTSDLVTVHQFSISHFLLSPNNLTMSIDQDPVNLVWVSNNSLWGELNGSYIGSEGPNAPRDEVFGSVNYSIFPGVKPTDYVLLSLTIRSQPTNNIPIAAGPFMQVFQVVPFDSRFKEVG